MSIKAGGVTSALVVEFRCQNMFAISTRHVWHMACLDKPFCYALIPLSLQAERKVSASVSQCPRVPRDSEILGHLLPFLTSYDLLCYYIGFCL